MRITGWAFLISMFVLTIATGVATFAFGAVHFIGSFLGVPYDNSLMLMAIGFVITFVGAAIVLMVFTPHQKRTPRSGVAQAGMPSWIPKLITGELEPPWVNEDGYTKSNHW